MKPSRLLLTLAFCSTLAHAAYDSTNQASQGPLKIVRMTPEGTNAQTRREIVFTFDRDVVPLGRMERNREEIPISILPTGSGIEVKCQWRWFSRNTLGCRLDEADQLKLATDYSVIIKPGLKTEEGAGMAETEVRYFSTRRPTLEDVNFKTWKAPDIPVLRLNFSQPVARSSVTASVYFDNDTGFDIFPDEDYREEPLWLPLPGEPLSYLNLSTQKLLGDDQTIKTTNDEYRRNWLIQPRSGLGLDRNVLLRIKPGLASSEGPLAGNETSIKLSFDTFPEFRFLGLRCYPSKETQHLANKLPGNTNEYDQSITIPPGTPLEQQPKCDPLRGTALRFSTPVINQEVKTHTTLAPDLAGGRKDYDPWQNSSDYSSLGQPHRKGQTYSIWLPEFLRANQPYQLTIDQALLRDEFGSTLPTPVSLAFATDHRAPKYHMPHDNVVLESNVDSEQPIYVTNIDRLSMNYSRMTAGKATEASLTGIRDVPQALDIAYRFPLGIRDLLGGQSGVVAGIFTTQPYIANSYCDNCFFSQVTPWQVHAKIGHFNSMVWVVDFATGKPVENAKVELFLSNKHQLFTPAGHAIETQASTNTSGIAELAGRSQFDPLLNRGNYDTYWYIRVTRGSDMALLPLNYDYRVYDNDDGYSWRSVVEKRQKYHHIHSWGTTAQGIYRTGDTMQYKIYLRNQDNNTFVEPPSGPYTLTITDPKGNVVSTRKDIQLNEFGSLDGEYPVPANAAVGWYVFEISAGFTQKIWTPMRVLVADFTPAPFRASSEINGEQFTAGDTLEVTSHARLHAGGPYASAKARVTVNLTPSALKPADKALRNFYFDTLEGARDTIQLGQQETQLDQKGDASNTFTLPDTNILIGKLAVETAVRDDRGKYIATQSSARFVSRERFIGLKMDGWYLQTDKTATVQWIVTDEQGHAVKGTPADIRVELDEVKASRVKGAGNAYITEYKHSWKEVARCEGKSSRAPKDCTFTPDTAGTYRIIGTVADSKERKHSTTITTWAAGKGYVLWDEPTDNSLEVIPLQDSYKVGDTARFLVKNPYPDGRALISVERYGVMRHFEQVWDSSTPIVEIPIGADDTPGFYLSIMVMSPRVDKPVKDGVVDLGKPAFKIAYRQIDVVDPVKQLKVAISSDKETYKPREKATIRLQVTDNSGKAPTERQELAIAVLDESVFDLVQGGNNNFDPYKGFYYLDGRDMENFSLLTRLVGRQNFPKKGANQGGDGGSSLDMRTLFKFVSYWNPSVSTDSRGKASITVDLPDNLTGWRVLAMATTPTDRMGLGVHSFAVNKPVEIRPVMPNQITEGDAFKAGFTVMNRTSSNRKLLVKVSSTGAIDKPALFIHRIKAKPFKRETVWLPIQSKGDGTITLTASAEDVSDKEASDALQHSVPVKKYRSLLTAANYGTTTGNSITEPVAIPEGIYGDVGNISMVVSPSVIANVDGAFDYMRDYPYWCWEQRLSKAVLAAHYLNLKAYISSDDWKEAEQLPQQMLDDAAMFQAPNGGMTFWVPNDLYVSPYLSAYTQLAFNWLRRSNYTIPAEVEKKLKAYLHTLLQQDVFPTFYSSGMSSSVRAVALAALAESGDITLHDLQRYRASMEKMDLFGKAHFLQAAMRVPGGDAMVRDTLQNILGQATQSGGKFQFNETWDDSYRQILATPLRSNCAILESLVYLGEQPAYASLTGDIPFKLVRSITQSRGARTHFENTQENVFCMNSIISFSRVYEATTPDMLVKVSLDQSIIGENRFASLKDKPVTHSAPIKPGDVGQRRTLTLEKQGSGRVYYSSRLQYAPLAVNADNINAGIEMRREYSVERKGTWELLAPPFRLQRGELVRVDLYVSVPTSRNFVVVNDPVPGGLEPVNRDLATASTVDADKGKFQAAGGSWYFHYDDWSYYGASYWNFYHKELKHDSVRFYSDYLPAGNYHLFYTAQAIATGHFRLQPAAAEEMYDPDVFGKTIPAELDIGEDESGEDDE